MNRAARPQPDAPAALLRHQRANREVRLGQQLVGYELQRAQRRTIGFVVNQDGLAVRAPRWVAQPAIDAALQIKADWILRKLADLGQRLQQHRARPDCWQDGGLLPYLGAPLRLQLQPELSGPARLQAPEQPGDPSALLLPLPLDATAAQIRALGHAWLQAEARRLFSERCRHYAALLQVQVRRLALSAARTRWGSASSSGQIRLNWRLIHHRPSAIDYVVVHELAHLREMNHSPAFWAIVRTALPGFEAERELLRQGLAALPD